MHGVLAIAIGQVVGDRVVGTRQLQTSAFGFFRAKTGQSHMTAKKADNTLQLATMDKVAAYLNAAVTGDDVNGFPPALGHAVRAVGITEVLTATGYSRQKLSRATKPDADPKFETVQKIISGMDLKMRFVPMERS
jgi:probable addiction module antidote protein